jgi:hypothetical protein
MQKPDLTFDEYKKLDVKRDAYGNNNRIVNIPDDADWSDTGLEPSDFSNNRYPSGRRRVVWVGGNGYWEIILQSI